MKRKTAKECGAHDPIHIKRINICSFLEYYINVAETHLYLN